jgi:hypothetical protein
VKLDKEIGKVIDYETFDRSEEWKENVLTNKTIKEVTKAFLTKGKHIIQLRMIDAGYCGFDTRQVWNKSFK